VVERDGIGLEVRVVGRVHGRDQIFRPSSSRGVAEVSQEFGEVRVSLISREPGSSIRGCSGEQAMDGRGGMIGTGGEVTVGKELGGKGSAGGIGKASRKSGRGSSEKRWVEFGGKTGERKRVQMKCFNIGGNANGVDAWARKVGDSKMMVTNSAGGSKDGLRNWVERVVDIERSRRLGRGTEGP
jgi:hypothetical protein